jgi:hypothetical protein
VPPHRSAQRAVGSKLQRDAEHQDSTGRARKSSVVRSKMTSPDCADGGNAGEHYASIGKGRANASQLQGPTRLRRR